MEAVKELLDAGQLHEAVEAMTREVKAHPSEVQRRTLLFDLLSFAGDLDRAERQLDVIGHQSAQAEIGVQVYRDNIKAERARQRFFAGGAPPHFFAEPPACLALHLRAVTQLRAGLTAEARVLLDEAEEARPALRGKLNQQPFEDFRDYDDLTAPALELIVRDEYAWLPFAQLRRLEIAPPRYLRDLLWLPGRIEAADGVSGNVFLPALYAGSSGHANELVKLGRMTDWQELADGLFVAAGLHIWLADDREIELPEVRTLELE